MLLQIEILIKEKKKMEFLIKGKNEINYRLKVNFVNENCHHWKK